MSMELESMLSLGATFTCQGSRRRDGEVEQAGDQCDPATPHCETGRASRHSRLNGQ